MNDHINGAELPETDVGTPTLDVDQTEQNQARAEAARTEAEVAKLQEQPNPVEEQARVQAEVDRATAEQEAAMATQAAAQAAADARHNEVVEQAMAWGKAEGIDPLSLPGMLRIENKIREIYGDKGPTVFEEKNWRSKIPKDILVKLGDDIKDFEGVLTVRMFYNEKDVTIVTRDSSGVAGVNTRYASHRVAWLVTAMFQQLDQLAQNMLTMERKKTTETADPVEGQTSAPGIITPQPAAIVGADGKPLN